jgi:hypothetical protein
LVLFLVAVGQLGDNTLTPAGIDMSGLKLSEGVCFARSGNNINSHST